MACRAIVGLSVLSVQGHRRAGGDLSME